MKNLLKHWAFWVSLVVILVGCGVLTAAVSHVINSENTLKQYTQTTAIVVGYEEHKSFDNEDHHTVYTYAEVVEYEVDGVTYTAINPVSSSNPKKVGERMKIAIKPDDPEQCLFVGSERFETVFLFVFGGAIVLFGTAIITSVVRSLKE